MRVYGSVHPRGASITHDVIDSAGERLANEAVAAQQRAARREAQRLEEEARVCPFRPQVNDASHKIAEDADGRVRDVFQRLENAAAKTEAKRRERELEAVAADSALFKPSISDATDFLLTSRPDRLNESPLERTERLTYVDAQRREHVKKQLQQRHYSQYLHRPTIDTISAKLARSKTNHELCDNPQGKALKQELAQQRKLEMDAECPFKPQMDTHSEALAAVAQQRAHLSPESVAELGERLAHQQKERQASLERARRELEARALRECTFTPKLVTNKKLVTATAAEDAPAIRGLGKYMERKDLARRQAEERRQREQKVFLIEPVTRAQPFTVPEPFKISSVNQGIEERRERLLQELAQRNSEECTFHPRTNETAARELLRQAA